MTSDEILSRKISVIFTVEIKEEKEEKAKQKKIKEQIKVNCNNSGQIII